ncbi:MAG: ABC transporter ATP-binding protein [Spirochaetales bacterium]|nr:ABC transporter ATP-binding protein [Spirochaetales bacterium]
MVDIHNLTFSYWRENKRGKNRYPLFDNLSLSLKSPNIYGLLGRNGAGKTTLLKIITGQLFKNYGEISVLGADPAKRLPGMLSRIYFLPEVFYLPSLRGYEYVKIHSPFYPEFSEEAFRKNSQEFDIDPDKRLNSLSYGQKKKFLIGFGLATRCSLIVFDEPTNGLDIPSKSQFRRLVSNSVQDNQTFIISTHQVRDLEHIIDPIIILDTGKVILNESMERISAELSMTIQRDEPEETNTLYSEKTLGGYAVIKKGPSGGEAIDIEILFNTVISNREKVIEIFNENREDKNEA